MYKNGVKKVILIGGEPTIHPKFIEIVSFLHNLGFKVSLSSNGRKFSEKNFSQKTADAGISSVDISIKGCSEEEYIKNTHSTGFFEMVQGFHNLQELGIKVSVSYVLCDTNKQSIIKFKNCLLENKLDHISIQLFKPSVEETKYSGPLIKELADMCEFTYECLKETELSFSFEMSIPLCTLSGVFLEKLIQEKKIRTCCHITKGKGIIFDTNFNIQPCNHFVNYPLNSTAVETNKIINFWNSNEPIAFRKRISTYPSEKCQNCHLWEKCGGGCYLRWLSMNPKEHISGLKVGKNICQL